MSREADLVEARKSSIRDWAKLPSVPFAGHLSVGYLGLLDLLARHEIALARYRASAEGGETYDLSETFKRAAAEAETLPGAIVHSRLRQEPRP